MLSGFPIWFSTCPVERSNVTSQIIRAKLFFKIRAQVSPSFGSEIIFRHSAVLYALFGLNIKFSVGKYDFKQMYGKYGDWKDKKNSSLTLRLCVSKIRYSSSKTSSKNAPERTERTQPKVIKGLRTRTEHSSETNPTIQYDLDYEKFTNTIQIIQYII